MKILHKVKGCYEKILSKESKIKDKKVDERIPEKNIYNEDKRIPK
jgi:hypothetical protein